MTVEDPRRPLLLCFDGSPEAEPCHRPVILV
jgi:hypothetical protein